MGKVIPLKKSKSRPKYKYALNEQIGMLPKSMPIKNLIDHLETVGITRTEFYRDRDIRYGSDSSIPSDRLFIYAQVFDCTPVELLNEKPVAQSIRQKSLKLKSGLS